MHSCDEDEDCHHHHHHINHEDGDSIDSFEMGGSIRKSPSLEALLPKHGRNNHHYTQVSNEYVELDKDAANGAKEIKTTKLRVQNICCGKEATLIQNNLNDVDGVENVLVNIVGRMCYVKHDSSLLSSVEIVNKLNKLHLGVSIFESGHSDSSLSNSGKRNEVYATVILLFILTVLFAILIATIIMKLNWAMWIAVSIIVIGGLPVLWKALLSLKKRLIDINLLMIIAVGGTVALRQWIEGATVIYVFAIAEVLQRYSAYKVHQTISGLMLTAPDVAVLAESGKTVAAKDVVVGTKLVVCAGERIPLDGKVCGGRGAVDESSVTGESTPVEKTKDAVVCSGTILQSGYLEIITTSDASSSTVSKIGQLVEEAQSNPSHTEHMMNRFAKFYTPIVMLLALLVFAVPAILGAADVGDYKQQYEVWGLRALMVLVIACPCALVMSAPIPVVCGITAAAKSGILIKGGAYLETLAHVNTIAFDKTGTLTEGRFQVCNIHVEDVPELEEDDILIMAAALESKSSHPIAAAIVNHYSGCITTKIENFGSSAGLPEVKQFKNTFGLGLSGIVNEHIVHIGNMKLLEANDIEVDNRVNDIAKDWSSNGETVVFVSIDGKLTMMLGLADRVRATSGSVIHRLSSLGINSVIITGDTPGPAAAIQRNVGADMVLSQMKPQDKLQWIKEQQTISPKDKRIICMVGDGVNDSPSLAAANVGIAIGVCGAALAVESAGVALMNDNLIKVYDSIKLSRGCRRIIFQNIVGAVLLKIIVAILAIAGLVQLYVAIIADVVGLLFVILNGMRPLLWQQQGTMFSSIRNKFGGFSVSGKTGERDMGSINA